RWMAIVTNDDVIDTSHPCRVFALKSISRPHGALAVCFGSKIAFQIVPVAARYIGMNNTNPSIYRCYLNGHGQAFQSGNQQLALIPAFFNEPAATVKPVIIFVHPANAMIANGIIVVIAASRKKPPAVDQMNYLFILGSTIDQISH